MAWSSASVSASIALSTSNDAPMFVSANVLDTTFVNIEWETTGVATGTAPDDTAATAPSTFLYDWDLGARTYSDTAATTHYIVAERTSGNFGPFDTCLIGPNTFGDDGATAVSLQIADDDAFTTNLQTIASWVPTDNSRLASTSLYHTGMDPLAYSSVKYVRLKIEMGGSKTPGVSEWILATRRQLNYKADLPYAPDYTESRSTIQTSRSGVAKVYSQSRGLSTIAPIFTLDSATFSLPATIYAACDYGARPVAYIEDPGTYPERWRMVMLQEPTRNLAHILGTGTDIHATWAPILIEQPPAMGREL